MYREFNIRKPKVMTARGLEILELQIEMRRQSMFKMGMSQSHAIHKSRAGLDTGWNRTSLGDTGKIKSTYPVPYRFRI